MTLATASFCVICDAEPGQCDHHGHRYLEDIVYEAIPEGGWRVPEHERARWEAEPLRPEPQPPAGEPKPLGQLVVELEAWVMLDHGLETKLRHVYELDPARVSRLVDGIIEGHQGGRLHSPAGLLWKRLGELEHRKT